MQVIILLPFIENHMFMLIQNYQTLERFYHEEQHADVYYKHLAFP